MKPKYESHVKFFTPAQMLKVPLYANPETLLFIVKHWYEIDYYKNITWSYHFPRGIPTAFLWAWVKTTNDYITSYMASAEWTISW